MVEGAAKNDTTCQSEQLSLLRGTYRHEGKEIMFWIVTSFFGLIAFAVALGRLSVWFMLLKFALLLALLVIALMGIILFRRRPKGEPTQKSGSTSAPEAGNEANVTHGGHMVN